MYRLMKLELKKHKIGWYIKGTLIANASILAMLYFFTVIENLKTTLFSKQVMNFLCSPAC